MKIFVLTVAILLLSFAAAAKSIRPEFVVLGYIISDNEIKDVLGNLSAKFHSVDAGVKKVMLDLNNNITDLRTRYGEQKYNYYHTKYNNKWSEFKHRPDLNITCQEKVTQIMDKNKSQQTSISNAIIVALKSWKEQYDLLDSIIINRTVELIALEKTAHDCSRHFDGNGDIRADDCAWVAYKKADHLADITFPTGWDGSHESAQLTDAKDAALGKLYENLKPVFNFYDNEKLIDDWFTNNC